MAGRLSARPVRRLDLHLYAGADHMWLGSPTAASDAPDRTIAFLGTRLGSAQN